MSDNSVSTIWERNIASVAQFINTACSPRRFANSLVELNLIGFLSALEKVDIVGISVYDQISQLLSAVINKISLETPNEAREKSLQLLQLLRSLDPSLSDLADSLSKQFDELNRGLPRQPISARPRTRRQRQNIRTNTESYKAYCQLRREYGLFVISVKRLLQNEQISLNDLKTMWSHMSKYKLNHDSMQSNTIDEFMRLVSHDGELPSLQYQCLAELIISFSPSNGKKLVKDYEAKVKWCLRSQIHKTVQQLLVKFNGNFEKFVEKSDDEMELKITLGKIFSFPPEDIVLVAVNKGCVQLTYLIPLSIGRSLQNLDFQEKSTALQQAKVISIFIDGNVLWTEDKEVEPAQVELEPHIAVTVPDEYELPTKDTSVPNERSRDFGRSKFPLSLKLRGDIQSELSRSMPLENSRRQNVALISLTLAGLVIIGLTGGGILNIPFGWLVGLSLIAGVWMYHFYNRRRPQHSTIIYLCVLCTVTAIFIIWLTSPHYK